MGGPEGRSQRACEPAGRSGSGGPEPKAYLKRSDREEPTSSGSPRGMPRGVGAGGEISRAAMVSQGRGRPRSCAQGAGNGAGCGSNDDDHAAGASRARAIRQGQRGRATMPSDRRPKARKPTPSTSPWRMMTDRGSGQVRKAKKASDMLMITLRLLTGRAALLLIAAAPPGQRRVSYLIDGDTFRPESGLALASPGSTRRKHMRDRPDAGARMRSADPRPRVSGYCSKARPSPSFASGTTIIARARG